MGILSYWNTMFFNRYNCTETDKRIKNHWWNRGCILCVALTTRCNLHCDYCPMFYSSNKYPKFEESTLEEWKKYFEEYPYWLSQIFLTGGEPTKMPYLAELTNWLVDRGHHVLIFSNLYNPENLIGIKKSFKFILLATLQAEDDAERYKKVLSYLRSNTKFRIISQEMEDEHRLKDSVHKDKFTVDWFNNINKLTHVPPDAPRSKKQYLGCIALYRDWK